MRVAAAVITDVAAVTLAVTASLGLHVRNSGGVEESLRISDAEHHAVGAREEALNCLQPLDAAVAHNTA
jgi:hypothetical protein